MRNWKIYLIIFYGFTVTTVSAYAQDDTSQELISLLNKGNFFKSQELYQDICDTIHPGIDLYYKFRMEQFAHKQDSAAIYLDRIITDYPDLFWGETIYMYAMLFDIYAINLRNYEKSLYTYECMEQHLTENPYNLDEKELTLWEKGNEGRLRIIKQLADKPSIRIKREDTNDAIKIKYDDERLFFNAEFNGIERKTHFDTGSSYHYIINRKEAEAIGIKCSEDEMEKDLFNGTEMNLKRITLDSLKIGNITLYNIPTTILEHSVIPQLPDSLRKDTEKVAKMDSIHTNMSRSTIGLPIIKLIGKMVIDYENQKMIFPVSETRLDTLKKANIFFYEFNLRTPLQLNGKNFMGILDTGLDNNILIDTLFYEQHKNDIPIDTTFKTEKLYFTIMTHQIWPNIPYKIPSNLHVTFNGITQQIPPDKEEIKIYPVGIIYPWNFFDGVIGYDFFKRIGKKVLLDLDNMRLEAIE